MSGVRIDPNAYYHESTVRRELKISSSAITKARRMGVLQPSRPGNEFIYRGDELIALLNGDKPAQVAESELVTHG